MEHHGCFFFSGKYLGIPAPTFILPVEPFEKEKHTVRPGSPSHYLTGCYGNIT